MKNKLDEINEIESLSDDELCELPFEKLDEVCGGFLWGTTRIVPVRPPVKPLS